MSLQHQKFNIFEIKFVILFLKPFPLPAFLHCLIPAKSIIVLPINLTPYLLGFSLSPLLSNIEHCHQLPLTVPLCYIKCLSSFLSLLQRCSPGPYYFLSRPLQ